jgi:squalene-hopene/tetraprenyl-beta-curcumene cyclase
LATVDREKYRPLIERGLQWLCDHQNADGGWGDTVQSPSNLSTTLLCYSALAIPHSADAYLETTERAQWWLLEQAGTLEPRTVAKAVEQQYGRDRTFSVPILTMAALSGRLGTGSDAWRLVRPLPFELAVLPHRLYKWLRLPVVSYALPALIAIGQARYEHLRPVNPLTRCVRHLARESSLEVLTKLQPEDGGFLEAAPLTSFVVMSLAASGRRDHKVVAKGVEFLVASIREDGSWPIDTNLATWVTTLSINAVFGNSKSEIPDSDVGALAPWLLSCQQRDIHPFTRAEPGGWAWSNLPGAVPDGDDTAGAMLALHTLSADSDISNLKSEISDAVCAGVEWLLSLQNSDGGIPTFCRGWTKLPFDKSTPDITAHAIGAMSVWLPALPTPLGDRTSSAIRRALRYMANVQRADGSWVPLWFGNQHAPGQENPAYGTSRALTHLSNCGLRIANCGFDSESLSTLRERAAQWLLDAQNADGGWGGSASVASSIEETSLAVDALATALLQSAIRNPKSAIEAVQRGADWLIASTHQGRSTPASPVGLYFARLWYFEELYPLIFALSALTKVQRLPDRRRHADKVG